MNKYWIRTFEKVPGEFQCLKGYGTHSNVYKDKIREPIMKGSGAKSNVCKDKDTVRILMF